MASWTSASTTTTNALETNNSGDVQPTRSATVSSYHPLAEKIRRHYLSSREQSSPPQAAINDYDGTEEESIASRARNQFTEAAPPLFIKTTGGSAILKSSATGSMDEEEDLKTTKDGQTNNVVSRMPASLRQPKRFSTGSFPPIELITQLEEVTATFASTVEFSSDMSSSTSSSSASTYTTQLSVTLSSGTSEKASYPPSPSVSAKSLLKKKEIKKVKKLEKQEKEQKKKREEDMRKMAQEEEITDTLVGQKRQLEDVQLALVRSDPLDEKLQRRASDLTKKMVAKGTLLLKAAKALKNNPTQQKYKRDFLEIDKEFTETTKRFLLDICTGNFTITPALTSGGSSIIDPETALSAISPSGSPESRSPPTSPPVSPRFGNHAIPTSGSYNSINPNNVSIANDYSETPTPSTTSYHHPPPPLRRTRSSTTNALRGIANASTPPASSLPSSSSSTSRFLSPPRNREGTSLSSSQSGSTSSLLNSPNPVGKRSEKDVKKMGLKKAETMSRLGELHSLFTTLIDYFQPFGGFSTPAVSTNTPPTSPPETKPSPAVASFNNQSPSPSSSSPHTERGWITTSPNTSGSNISALLKNDSAIYDKDINASSLASDLSDDLELSKKDKSKRVSVGRTFGRMVYSSTKKLPESSNVNTTTTFVNPLSPKPPTSKYRWQKKRRSDLI